MSDAMAHRGPDGRGGWESPPAEARIRALLAHRRLAISIFRRGGSHGGPGSGHVLVFNGEIYNFQELPIDSRPPGSRSSPPVTRRGGVARFRRPRPRRAPAGSRRCENVCFRIVGSTAAEASTRARSAGDQTALPGALQRSPRSGRWPSHPSCGRCSLGPARHTPRLFRAAASVSERLRAGPLTAVEGVESLWPASCVFRDDGSEEAHRTSGASRRPGPDGVDDARLTHILEDLAHPPDQ